MDKVNATFANEILFCDPETGEELRPKHEPIEEGNRFVLHVTNKDGTRNWKHTILTEEV